ncbi:conserved hypothetical protein [uncultured Paludibacter sp.]|nr:conserved hypothetical protein [uncultured Paludibacter sp.]
MADIKNDKYTKSRFNAYLGNYMNFGSYLSSYENAFNTLIDSVNTSGFHVDYLAYPILFTARHSLELGFKANIRYFAKYSKKSNFVNTDSHNLIDLFSAFKIHVRESIINLKKKYQIDVEKDDIKDFESYCKMVDDLVDKFDVLDKGSFCFRYPVDKSNKRVFQPTDIVNILDIKELFDKAMILLNHTADIFSKYTDYADYIEQSYEEEMRSTYGY